MNMDHDLWLKLPLSVRQMWWHETDYGKNEPSSNLIKEVNKYKIDKPHIKKVRGIWEIRKNRDAIHPIALSTNFSKLKNCGPWAVNEVNRATYVGDAKNPI